MRRYFLIQLILCAAISINAISYNFSFVKTDKTGRTVLLNEQTIYGQNSAFGFDFNSSPTDGNPFFFSVDVPEGNYLVTLTLGSSEMECNTTVKAESRRIMLLNIPTKKGQFVTHSFVVNVRNTKISETESVRIKTREQGKLIWDDKLTLEFNGANPSVTALSIKKVDNVPTVFLAGNSTVVDEGEEPWCGWGQAFTQFFGSKLAVANYAESGEAANTFVSSKRFAKLLTKIKKGDFLIIEFGHNDQKQKGEGKGPYTSYKSDLKFLAIEARKKGATPILVTPMHRRNFDANGKVINTHGEYPDAVRQLAQQEKIALIDLTHMSAILYEAWGEEDSKKAFVHYPAGTFPNQPKALADNTHFNTYGGTQIAKCILKGIIDNKLPIKKFLKPEYKKAFNPAQPDDFSSFHVPLSPFSSTIKPDGN